MTRSELKKAILESSDRYEKVRFRNGEIHVFACPMKNTNQDGWEFIGYEQDVDIKGIAGIGIYPE